MKATTVSDDFRAAIERAGLTPPDEIVADGRLHRFSSSGERGDDAGWYALFDDDSPAGAFGCWRTGVRESWSCHNGHTLSTEERAQQRQRLETIQRQREAEGQRRHAEAAVEAQRIWSTAASASTTHPYLERKRVQPHGVRVHPDGRLIVPMMCGSTLSSLQFIDPTGGKKFLYGGRITGCSYLVGDMTSTLCITEGLATAASVHEATGYAVVVSFDAGNLLAVAQAYRATYPHATILICGDDDIRTDGTPNKGREAASAAAQAIGGVLAMPELDGKKCDWNDVHVQHGLDAVKQAIDAILFPQASVLDDVERYLQRFICYPNEHARVAHVLWIAHTHLMPEWESTPRLAFLSPEPRSGKTRCLEATETLVPRPMLSINATAAAMFRKVSSPDGPPTILYDEIDAIFGPKAKEHEDIRALINAGHRRGASAHRCVTAGKQIELEEFPCYCAVAMGGLGALPDTILTRSIVIRMRRRAPSETVEPYRSRLHAPEGRALRDRLATWATAIRPRLDTNPAMPDGVTDRDADCWEALLSIADAAGGSWPDRARVSSVTHVTDAIGNPPSLGIRLLADLRTVFRGFDALTTKDILEALINLEDTPWGDLRGKPLDSRRLSKLLKAYEIAPKVLRVGTDTARGYERTALHDARLRYLSPEEKSESPSPLSPIVNVTTVTEVTPDGDDAIETFDDGAPDVA